MHIENPDALRNWLTPKLEPLCDADPNALAKYVLALLKKDKPQVELSVCMAEQLDVFLGKETKLFLEKLFEVIKSQEYITIEKAPELVVSSQRETTPPIASQTSSSSNSSGRRTKEATDESKEIKIERPSSTTIASNNKKLVVVTTPTSKSKSQEPISKTLSEGARRRRISNRSKSRSKSRSRSKSLDRLERIRRSRSRDRRMNEHNREKNTRPYRNNSPPASSSRRYDYRKNDRLSPKLYRGGNVGRHRSKSPIAPRSRSRSLSPSFRKSPNRDEGLFELKSKRCRDFDEKGYCMRGETCPWDHGVDPVVLEDLNNPSLAMTPVAAAMNMRAAPIHSEYNPDAPDLWHRGGPGFVPGARMHLPVPAPRQPFFFRGGPPLNFQMPPGGPPLPRELIPVPVMDPNHPGAEMSGQMKRRFEPEDGVALAEGPKRKMPINSRLGPRINQSGMNANSQQNCSLELRKIPRGLNAISHLNDHFSKFGKITNIQIAYENDPEAAIITFSAHAEANVAYRSTEAVLNNRFIKVFWHSGAGAGGDNPMSGPTGSLPKPSELSVRRYPYQPNTPQTSQAITPTSSSSAADSTNSGNIHQITTSGSAETPTTSSGATIAPKGSTTYINSASPAAQQAQLRLKNAKLTRATTELNRKIIKEKQKEVFQRAHGLHQKKQELMQKYLSQMKQVVEIMERTDVLDPQRTQMMNTVKGLEGSIDELRKELENDQVHMAPKAPVGPPPRKTKEQQQKELLDVELELISKEQHGDNDTYAIQKRYNELQKSLNRPHFANAGPRPPVVLRQPIARFGSTSVDRRPTSIQITGFAVEESDAVLGHFKHYGEITKNVMDEVVPCLVLSYATRINAEQALARGRQFKEKTLNIVWFIPATVENNSQSKKNESLEKNDGTFSDPTKESSKLEIAEKKDALAPMDEEEEDIEEERSWRRGYDAE